MDLDLTSPKADAVSPMDSVAASGSPVMPVASVAASPKADAVSSVDSAAAFGSPVMLDAFVVRGKQFSFPPVLEDAPMFSVHAKVSSDSKSTLRRESIQLYRISRRELENRLSIDCSVYFVDKGGDSRIEVRDVG